MCNTLNNRLIKKVITTAIFVVCISSVANALPISYELRKFSPVANHLVETIDPAYLYSIDLDTVDQELPLNFSIQKASIKQIHNGWVPIKPFLTLFRKGVYGSRKKRAQHEAYDLFDSLAHNVPFNYVVLPKEFIFTETSDHNIRQSRKDWFSKHYFLSKLSGAVRYAGEFTIYKSQQSGDLYVVIDNGSGTYQPSKKYLGNLKHMLESQLHDQTKKLHIVTKNFDQRIDVDELVNNDQVVFTEQR